MWTANDAATWWEAIAKSPSGAAAPAARPTSAAVTTDQVPLDVTGAYEAR